MIWWTQSLLDQDFSGSKKGTKKTRIGQDLMSLFVVEAECLGEDVDVVDVVEVKEGDKREKQWGEENGGKEHRDGKWLGGEKVIGEEDLGEGESERLNEQH